MSKRNLKKKKKIKTKADGQQHHAIKRARQRFSLFLQEHDYDHMVSLIKKGKSEFLQRTSRRTTIHKIEFEGTSMAVVYDSMRRKIVTVMPPDWFGYNEEDENRKREEKIKAKEERRKIYEETIKMGLRVVYKNKRFKIVRDGDKHYVIKAETHPMSYKTNYLFSHEDKKECRNYIKRKRDMSSAWRGT